jgi:hypothetical protein
MNAGNLGGHVRLIGRDSGMLNGTLTCLYARNLRSYAPKATIVVDGIRTTRMQHASHAQKTVGNWARSAAPHHQPRLIA